MICKRIRIDITTNLEFRIFYGIHQSISDGIIFISDTSQGLNNSDTYIPVERGREREKERIAFVTLLVPYLSIDISISISLYQYVFQSNYLSLSFRASINNFFTLFMTGVSSDRIWRLSSELALHWAVPPHSHSNQYLMLGCFCDT